MANWKRALGKTSPKAPSVDFSGTWRNQIGSAMTITVAGQSVSGEYVSVDSSNGTTAKGRLVGSVDGDLIAFVVNWDDYLSLTAWTGQLVGGTLKTLWLLVKDTAEDDPSTPGDDEALKLWQSTNVGADEFKLVP